MNWLIKISDSHTTDGQTERSELETVAQVSGTADDYCIVYDEQGDEIKGCQTTVHVTGGKCVLITRKGAYNTEMKMEKGKRNHFCYNTPMGQLDMGVYTSRVISEFSDEKILLDLTYTLDFNNELVSRNRVKITT